MEGPSSNLPDQTQPRVREQPGGREDAKMISSSSRSPSLLGSPESSLLRLDASRTYESTLQSSAPSSVSWAVPSPRKSTLSRPESPRPAPLRARPADAADGRHGAAGLAATTASRSPSIAVGAPLAQRDPLVVRTTALVRRFHELRIPEDELVDLASMTPTPMAYREPESKSRVRNAFQQYQQELEDEESDEEDIDGKPVMPSHKLTMRVEQFRDLAREVTDALDAVQVRTEALASRSELLGSHFSSVSIRAIPAPESEKTESALPGAMAFSATPGALAGVRNKLSDLARDIQVEIQAYTHIMHCDVDTILDDILLDTASDVPSLDSHRIGSERLPVGARTSNDRGQPSPESGESNQTTEASDHSSARAGPAAANDAALVPDLEEVPNDITGPLRWGALQFVNDAMGRCNLGVATCLAVRGPHVLAVGTSRGAVAVFSLGTLSLMRVLGRRLTDPEYSGDTQLPPLSALAVSQSGKYLASGHTTGLVCLWHLGTGACVGQVRPIARTACKGQKKSGPETWGHLEGCKICHLTFVGKSDRRIVSADTLGVAFYHVIALQILSSTKTSRFFGSYENRLNQSKLTAIFAIRTFGNYVALLTPFKMVVLDTRPIRTVYRHLRMDTNAPALGQGPVTGALNFVPSYPPTDFDSIPGVETCILASAWGNFLQLYRIQMEEHDSNIWCSLVFCGEVPYPVVAIGSLTSRYLMLIDDRPAAGLFCMRERTFIEAEVVPQLVGQDDLLDVTRNLGDQGELNYTQTAAWNAGTLYTVGENGLNFGVLHDPKLRLGALARTAPCSSVIHYALDLYHGNQGFYLTRTGDGGEENEEEIRDLVCRAVMTCLKRSRAEAEDLPQLADLLLAVGCGDFLYTTLYETVTELCLAPILFEHLRPRLSDTDGSWSAKPGLLHDQPTPQFVANVLAYFLNLGQHERYLSILENVNPALVDFDVEFHSCEAHSLHQGTLYLYHLMGDMVRGLETVASRDEHAAFNYVADYLPRFSASGNATLAESRSQVVHWVEARIFQILLLPEKELAWRVLDACFNSADDKQDLADQVQALIATGTVPQTARTFAQVALIAQNKKYPDHVVISSSDLHLMLKPILADDNVPASESIPKPLIQEAVNHLIYALNLSSEQLMSLVPLCEARGFWSVCEQIFHTLGDPASVIDCYVRGSDVSEDTFAAIARLLELYKESEQSAKIRSRIIDLSSALAAIDVEQFATLVCTLLPDAIEHVHFALEGTAHAPTFLAVLASEAPSPLPLRLLRQGVYDQMERGDEYGVHMVSRHLPYSSPDEIKLWMTYAQSKDLPKTSAILLEHCGMANGALKKLLKHYPKLSDLSLQLCRRHGSDQTLWVDFIRVILERGGLEKISLAFREIDNVPDILARVISKGGVPWTPDLQASLREAITSFSLRASFYSCEGRIFDSDRHEFAEGLLEKHRTGWAFSGVSCSICGEVAQTPVKAISSGHITPPFGASSMDWCTWDCGHAAHVKCSGDSTECCLCHAVARMSRHVKEVHGKSPVPRQNRHYTFPVRHLHDTLQGSPGSSRGPIPSSQTSTIGPLLPSKLPMLSRPSRHDWHGILKKMIEADEEEDGDD